VQSSRRLEREAGRNLEVIWLLGQFVALCRDMAMKAFMRVLKATLERRDWATAH
jgi:hypothetical protein